MKLMNFFKITRSLGRSVSILAAALCAGCASAPRLSRTPNILVGAVADPFRWAADDQKSSTAQILYVTDRAPERDKSENISYGSGRSKSLAFGSCAVEIGKDLPWQTLIEQSAALRRTLTLPLSIKSIQELGRFPETPLPLIRSESGSATDPEALRAQGEMAEAFRATVAGRLAHAPNKDAYVFIHGYNNSFDDAALVMAEVWHFLGRPGAPIVYTWPAGIGGVRGYTYDRESGEFTNYHIKQFLKALAATPGLERIHLIAHSRGTDVITTALRELFLESRAAGKDPREEFRIKNLVLAAPDMDLDVVTQRVNAERVPEDIGRVTVYVSSFDRALGMSDWLFVGVQRVGKLRHTDMSDRMRENLKNTANLDVINVTAKTDFIGHGYFHTNPNVCSDLVLVLRDNLDAGADHGRPLKPLAPGFWELPPGYLE